MRGLEEEVGGSLSAVASFFNILRSFEKLLFFFCYFPGFGTTGVDDRADSGLAIVLEVCWRINYAEED